MLRFALCVLLIGLATTARSGPLDSFAGRYRGCAISGGEWVSIETVLSVSGDRLSGTYRFLEPSGRQVSGTVETDGSTVDGQVNLRWRDVYGDGPAVFNFSTDGSRFDGYWTTETGVDRFSWYGVRSGQMKDCQVPVS